MKYWSSENVKSRGKCLSCSQYFYSNYYHWKGKDLRIASGCNTRIYVLYQALYMKERWKTNYQIDNQKREMLVFSFPYGLKCVWRNLIHPNSLKWWFVSNVFFFSFVSFISHKTVSPLSFLKQSRWWFVKH